jgi:hypothetical protein
MSAELGADQNDRQRQDGESDGVRRRHAHKPLEHSLCLRRM